MIHLIIQEKKNESRNYNHQLEVGSTAAAAPSVESPILAGAAEQCLPCRPSCTHFVAWSMLSSVPYSCLGSQAELLVGRHWPAKTSIFGCFVSCLNGRWWKDHRSAILKYKGVRTFFLSGPNSSNLTNPSIREKILWSFPSPAFFPGWNCKIQTKIITVSPRGEKKLNNKASKADSWQG